MNRRLAVPSALGAAALAGVVGTVAVTGGRAAPAPAPRVRLSTATAVVTNLATTVLTAGTLGYAPARPLINRLAGTYTSLPHPGALIRPGQALYRVDNQPVIELAGRVPAWRDLGPGVTPGPDVRELQASLIALGYARGLLSAPSGYYDALTADAVQRWQQAAGLPVTGDVGLGQVVFTSGPLRAGALSVAPGQPAAPGQRPYPVSTGRRQVTVPVTPVLPQVPVGSRVSIVLPSLARIPGRVTATGPAPVSAHGPGPGAASVLIVTPARPGRTGTATSVPVQVSLTVRSARHVLAVPVSALLALSGGGYGLELVTASGRHRLIGVRAGLFAAGLVQVSGAPGAGLAPGSKVVVAQ